MLICPGICNAAFDRLAKVVSPGSLHVDTFPFKIICNLMQISRSPPMMLV